MNSRAVLLCGGWKIIVRLLVLTGEVFASMDMKITLRFEVSEEP